MSTDTEPALVMAAHPAWCSARHCDAVTDPRLPADGGSHRSEPIGLDLTLLVAAAIGPVRQASAYLQQASAPWETTPFLVVDIDGETESAFLPLMDAVAVLDQLNRLIAGATAR